MAIPCGSLKLAAVPFPFAEPAAPLPASMVITPEGLIFCIVLAPGFATYKLPDASATILKELLNPVANVVVSE